MPDIYKLHMSNLQNDSKISNIQVIEL